MAVFPGPASATARRGEAPATAPPSLPSAEASAAERPGPPTPAGVAVSERPGPPTPAAAPATEAPATEAPAPQASDPERAPGSSRGGVVGGVVVHIVNELPRDDRGPIKLARHRSTTAARASSYVVFTTTYDELCTEPCGVPIDVSERPILFFVRDDNAVSHGFRIGDDEPEVTLSVRPTRRGMLSGGVTTLSIVLLPVAIPLMILGRPRVRRSSGAPSATAALRRVSKAKI